MHLVQCYNSALRYIHLAIFVIAKYSFCLPKLAVKVFPYLLVAVEVHRANLTIKSLQIYLPTNLWIKLKLLGVHNVIGHGTHTPFLCFLKRMIHWQTGRHATLNSSYSGMLFFSCRSCSKPMCPHITHM